MILDQIAIPTLGVSAIVLAMNNNPRHRRWASVLGISGQVFWFDAAVQAHQWGIVVASVFYTASWCYGLWQQWVVPWLKERAGEDE